MRLLPRDDVELILPLGPFRESDSKEVEDKLERLSPLGETPLYLAIRQAIGDLEGKGLAEIGGPAAAAARGGHHRRSGGHQRREGPMGTR